MPFMQRKQGGKIRNYTQGAGGQPTGQAHGTFPDTRAGQERADRQLKLLWSTYHKETKDLERYKDIDFHPPPDTAPIATQALNAGHDSGVTRSLAYGHPLMPAQVRSLSKRFTRGVRDWTPFGGASMQAWVQAICAAMDAADAKAAKALDYGKLIRHVKGGQQSFASTLDTLAGLVDRPDDLRLRSAAAYVRAFDTVKAAQVLEANVKAETSGNVGGGIPPGDDVLSDSYFRKGAEVYVRATNEVGVVKAVGIKAGRNVYRVVTKTATLICVRGDLAPAGKAAMKALHAYVPTLKALAADEPPTLAAVHSALETVRAASLAVGALDRPQARKTFMNLNAAHAILSADATATAMATHFLKAAAASLEDGLPLYEGESTEDQPQSDDLPLQPGTATNSADKATVGAGSQGGHVVSTQVESAAELPNPHPTESAWAKATKAFAVHIGQIAARGKKAEDEDQLLDELEVMRAYAMRDGSAETMAAQANVEEAVYEPQDAGMQAWANKVLAMNDEYLSQIKQMGF